METVSHGSRDVAFHRTEFDGDGHDVLYVHGSGGDHRDWMYQYDRDDRIRQVGSAIAVDLAGHGESDDVGTAPGTETLAAYADDVIAVARETNANVLVGNSMGGAIALHVLLERDVPLDGVVLVGSGAKLAVRDDLLTWVSEEFERAIELFYSRDQLFHDPDTEVAALTKEIMYESGSTVLERDLRTCDEFDVRERLDEISTPILAVTGEFDELTPPWYHEYVAERVRDAAWDTIPEAAHFSMAERPDRFNERVARFLARI